MKLELNLNLYHLASNLLPRVHTTFRKLTVQLYNYTVQQTYSIQKWRNELLVLVIVLFVFARGLKTELQVTTVQIKNFLSEVLLESHPVRSN